MADNSSKSDQLCCPFCEGARLKTLFSSHDRALEINTEFAIVQCCKCDLVFTYPRMDKSEFGEYYPPSYPPYTQTVLEEGTRLASRIFHALGRRLNPGFLERFPSGKVLDVGCGTGVASKRLLEQGHPVTGIEINRDAADYARNLGIQVINASFWLLMAFFTCVFPTSQVSFQSPSVVIGTRWKHLVTLSTSA